MNKTRMEAFSDGVMAILITILVLELKLPAGHDWMALRGLATVFCTYVLSFVFLGIYWNNHHHMLHAADDINGAILWANLHLLFWLSLVPFVTGWMGESHLAPLPTALYGVDMLAAGIGYVILQSSIIAKQGRASRLAAALGRDVKGKASTALYSVAIIMAFFHPAISVGIYIVVALMWLIPDPRIESKLDGPAKEH